MMHITVALPDEVAQQYYNASEKLDKALQIGTTPDAQTLMRFMLAGFSADDIAEVIAFVVTRPSHVDIDSVVIRPRDQARVWLVHREPS